MTDTAAVTPTPDPDLDALLESLSFKERAFVEFYLSVWDGAKAARLAGYAEKNAAAQASRMLRKANIQALIRARIEQLKMSADEAILGLAEQARGSLDAFISDEGEIDITQARAAGKMHLLKKYKKVKRYFKGELSEESVEIEIHDPQTARVWIGKHHQLFTDKLDISSGGQPIQLNVVYVAPDEKPKDEL